MIKRISAPKYRQPKLPYWVKLLFVPPAYKSTLRVGDVYEVVQYLEADGRGVNSFTVKIKDDAGQLVGLHNSQFEYVTREGQIING